MAHLLNQICCMKPFWSAIGLNWRNLFLSIFALFREKVSLKSFLSANSQVDITELSYNNEVIEYVNAYRDIGKRVALGR